VKGLTRRAVLLAGAGWAGGTWARAAGRAPHVGVLGAGIVGASIAYHLARAGARVTVFDARGPAQGATQNSFAWLNAFVADAHYRDLRLDSLAAYHALDVPLRLGILWGGYLTWAHERSAAGDVEESARELATSPFPVRRVAAADVAVLSPQLEPGPVASALYSAIDGQLNPVWTTRRFLEAAEALGATLKIPCRVRAIALRRGSLTGVTTEAGAVALDRLVVAGGVESPGLLARIGYRLPLRHAPGLLAHSVPTSTITRIVHDAPGGVGFKQMADGHFVAFDAAEPPDIPAHAAIRREHADFPDEALRRQHGERILGRLAEFVPATRGLALARVTLGFRPMPLDEYPVVGTVPGVPSVSVAVTHSGVTLAPILGQILAEEVLHGTRDARLAPYRPERFATRGLDLRGA